MQATSGRSQAMSHCQAESDREQETGQTFCPTVARLWFNMEEPDKILGLDLFPGQLFQDSSPGEGWSAAFPSL